MNPNTPDRVSCGLRNSNGRIMFGGYPMSFFANGLANEINRGVVDRTGVVKVLDFGLAKLAAPGTSSASFNPTLSPTITSPAMTGMRTEKGVSQIALVATSSRVALPVERSDHAITRTGSWDVTAADRIAVAIPVENKQTVRGEHTVVFVQNVIDEIRRRVK